MRINGPLGIKPSARLLLVGVLIFIHVTYNTDNIIGFMAFKSFILVTLPAGRSQPKFYRGRFVIECGRAKSGRFLDPLVQAELTTTAWEFV